MFMRHSQDMSNLFDGVSVNKFKGIFTPSESGSERKKRSIKE